MVADGVVEGSKDLTGSGTLDKLGRRGRVRLGATAWENSTPASLQEMTMRPSGRVERRPAKVGMRERARERVDLRRDRRGVNGMGWEGEGEGEEEALLDVVAGKHGEVGHGKLEFFKSRLAVRVHVVLGKYSDNSDTRSRRRRGGGGGIHGGDEQQEEDKDQRK